MIRKLAKRKRQVIRARFKRWSLSRDLSPINVTIQLDKNEVVLSSRDHRICFTSSQALAAGRDHADFAVWAFMPIAMALGRNLHINGAGDEVTVRNAEQLSRIWSSWMPQTYHSINVSFAEEATPRQVKAPDAELLFFSGGIDSTHTLVSRNWEYGKPDLLTVQGMDYGYRDEEGFADATKKTCAVTEQYAANRIFIKTDAYVAYKSLGLSARLMFVFVLAASGFLFSSAYRNLVMAADFSLYQQFEAFPYGSNFATNPLFASGSFNLFTHGDDVTRAEKLIPISASPAALASISLCKDTKVRPNNCGKCIKCTRTKYMFLAATGKIPKGCFIIFDIDHGTKPKFSDNEEAHKSFISATYNLARRLGNLDKIPRVVSDYLKQIQRN